MFVKAPHYQRKQPKLYAVNLWLSCLSKSIEFLEQEAGRFSTFSVLGNVRRDNVDRDDPIALELVVVQLEQVTVRLSLPMMPPLLERRQCRGWHKGVLWSLEPGSNV